MPGRDAPTWCSGMLYRPFIDRLKINMKISMVINGVIYFTFLTY